MIGVGGRTPRRYIFPRGRRAGVAILKDRPSASQREALSLPPDSVTTTTMHGSPPSRGTPARRGRSPRSSTASPGGIALPVPNSAKPPNTFTTCLSISVEGAVPIERLEITSANGNGDASAQASGSDSKRAPRKSKTDAIAALQSHAQSSGQEDLADMVNEDGAIQINLREGPPIPVKPALDMSTVKTPNRQWEAPQNVERPFGLTDCPVFRPTLEQFKDPLAYIKSISEKAKAYGMCKIVPPLGWEMPFVTDTEVCRIRRCSYFSRSFISTSEIPFQDTATTSEFDRGLVPSKGELFGAALSVPQAAGESTGRCAYNQSQASRLMVATQGGAETGRL